MTDPRPAVTLRFERDASPLHTLEPVRLLIVESHALTRVALRSLLELRPNLAIAGEAGDPESGLEAYLRVQPDVTIVGERPNSFNPADLVMAIRRHNPGAHFLFVTAKAPRKQPPGDSILSIADHADGGELSEAIRSLVDRAR